ncbi:nuclease-related domain-containing protein [Virgibacillus phasianinus]|nr:nuclease-related domain-containing protein [Virgibacillus phasianinus]
MLEQDLAHRQQGYDGEKNVDRFTGALLKNNFTLLHDVYLDSTFQIDTLIIGPHCMFVVEIKNYKGTITLDYKLNQFTREYKGVVTGFRNPIIQAMTNKLLLTNWLAEHNIDDIPIIPLFVISDPATIIKVIPETHDISSEIMHGEYMPQHVIKVNHALNKPHGHLHQKIGAMIVQECETYHFDYQQKYAIDPKDLLGGVQCTGCGRLGMRRQYNSWICEKCQTVSKTAHIQALTDYFLVKKPWISNSECMRFLGITSKNVATKLLKEHGLYYDPIHRRWHVKQVNKVPVGKITV